MNLLMTLRERGLTVSEVSHGHIRVAPKHLVTDEIKGLILSNKPQILAELRRENVPPVVWTGTAAEYRSLLIVREAELVAAKAELTGNPVSDWHLTNRIVDLEARIADIRKWLAEADRKGDEA